MRMYDTLIHATFKYPHRLIYKQNHKYYHSWNRPALKFLHRPEALSSYSILKQALVFSDSQQSETKN